MRALVLFLVLAVPCPARAQVIAGRHTIVPAFGATFATNDLLNTTTPIPYADKEEVNPVTTTMALDPGFYVGLRYAYNMTRRLAVEVEGSFGVSVFVIQMLEHLPPPDIPPPVEPEPQFETTTMDARIYRYGVNLVYHMGEWRWFHLMVQSGIGGQIMDLRQKGEIKTDPLRDNTLMIGAGGYFYATDRLGIRAEVRDYIYNFHFDNQFAGEDSDKIVANRDVGLAVAVSQPMRQHDIVVTLGFQVRVH